MNLHTSICKGNDAEVLNELMLIFNMSYSMIFMNLVWHLLLNRSDVWYASGL